MQQAITVSAHEKKGQTSNVQLENQQEIFLRPPLNPPITYSKTNVVCGSSEISAIGM